MNFQDVIRDVHDPSTHSLQTSSGSATIFAVVNTGAAGVGNSIVTINPRTDYIGLMSISGNVVVGTPTVFVGTPTLTANVGLPTVTMSNPDSSVIDANNTTTTPLGIDEVYTGTATDCTGYSNITNTIYADKDSAASGMQFQFCSDSSFGANTDTHSFTLDFSESPVRRFQFPVTARYFRIKYTNGGTGQGAFNIQNILHRGNVLTSIHRVGNNLTTDRSAQLVKSVIAGETTAGGGAMINVKVNPSGTLETNAEITEPLPTGKNYIGLVTVANTVTVGAHALTAGVAGIGFTTVAIASGSVGLNAGTAGIGFATVKVDTGTKYIGLATVNIGTIKAWANPNTYIGLVTAVVSSTARSITGNVTISDSKGFIGLTSVQGNVNIGGTNKTLIPKPIAISASGDATIFVPSSTFKVTHLLLNSDATVRMTIKSGASYLVGNASVGVTLSPNGGWVENGSPISPVYVGLANAASFVVNTSATANVGGKVIYFEE